MPGRALQPVYCTKIASKLARTFTDRHGLKDLCQELLGVELSKQQQSSDWGADEPDRRAETPMPPPTCCICMRSRPSSTRCWCAKAAPELAQAAFGFLPTRALLDVAGWPDVDIFEH